MQDWEYALIGAGIGGAGGYMLKDKTGLVIGVIGGGLLGYAAGLVINFMFGLWKGFWNNPFTKGIEGFFNFITNPLQSAQNFWGSIFKNNQTQGFQNILQYIPFLNIQTEIYQLLKGLKL